jgi:hypothetical protein
MVRRLLVGVAAVKSTRLQAVLTMTTTANRTWNSVLFGFIEGVFFIAHYGVGRIIAEGWSFKSFRG